MTAHRHIPAETRSAPPTALLCLCLLLFFLVLPPVSALAAPQRFVVGPLSLSKHGDSLFADVSLTVDDEDGLRDLLKDGAVLELNVSLNMQRERSWWTNADVASVSCVSLVRHDPLTREFLLTLPCGSDRQNTYKDRNLTRLLHASWRKMHIFLATDKALRQHGEGKTFPVSVTFSLRHAEVPPWLEKSSVFWSSDVVPEESRELEYRP